MDPARVSLLRWLRRQLREPLPARERLEVALDTGEKVLVESSSLHAQLKHGDRIAMRILADSVVVAQRNEP